MYIHTILHIEKKNSLLLLHRLEIIFLPQKQIKIAVIFNHSTYSGIVVEEILTGNLYMFRKDRKNGWVIEKLFLFFLAFMWQTSAKRLPPSSNVAKNRFIISSLSSSPFLYNGWSSTEYDCLQKKRKTRKTLSCKST